MPALGLSNKAVFDNDPNPDLYGEGEKRPQSDLYQEAYFSPLTSTGEGLWILQGDSFC